MSESKTPREKAEDVIKAAEVLCGLQSQGLKNLVRQQADELSAALQRAKELQETLDDAQVLRQEYLQRAEKAEAEANTAKCGEDAMLVCIQTACEELGEQVQPAFLSDLCAAVVDRMKKAEAEIKRAFSALSLCGVPEERARSVANGIQVFVTRIDREHATLKAELSRYREAEKALPVEPEPFLTGDGIDWVNYSDYQALRAHAAAVTAERDAMREAILTLAKEITPQAAMCYDDKNQLKLELSYRLKEVATRKETP
jgi:soluble cytochrome b562